MAYVAVTGGKEAIEESIRLLKYLRTEGEEDLSVVAIRDRMKLLVDRVMSEAGLYAPYYAALALKQCEGSPEEAVFILRAYRSTLSRNHSSVVLDGKDMRVTRRISAAFKDIPGGQVLGPSYDYVHRLLDFDLMNEKEEDNIKWRKDFEEEKDVREIHDFNRVSEVLGKQGLLETRGSSKKEPKDITMDKLTFPTERSAVLQTLTRADTGFISGVAYSSLRGFGSVHPTVGELRTGYLEVEIPYLYDEKESISIGEILMTEVETFTESEERTLDEFQNLKIGIGYGCVYGRNETKAIAMAIVDRALMEGGDAPVNDEEFVLYHGDSLEMNGFISHLKLPHYVTFQSILDTVRKKGGKNE